MLLSAETKKGTYYSRNKEKILANRRRYYLENKKKISESARMAYLRNPLPKREYAKKYAQDNPNRREEYMKTWLAKHPDQRKLFTRNSRIRKYGISPETYYEMLGNQDHQCGICGAKPKKNKALGIDHDHKTGKVRGLLCDKCNLALGHYETFAEKATRYLTKYKQN